MMTRCKSERSELISSSLGKPRDRLILPAYIWSLIGSRVWFSSPYFTSIFVFFRIFIFYLSVRSSLSPTLPTHHLKNSIIIVFVPSPELSSYASGDFASHPFLVCFSYLRLEGRSKKVNRRYSPLCYMTFPRGPREKLRQTCVCEKYLTIKPKLAILQSLKNYFHRSAFRCVDPSHFA